MTVWDASIQLHYQGEVHSADRDRRGIYYRKRDPRSVLLLKEFGFIMQRECEYVVVFGCGHGMIGEVV